MKKLLTISFIVLISSCINEEKCEFRTDYTYYDTSNIRTKTITDCKGNVREYHHYQMNCHNCGFSVFYSTDGKPDSISGKPWIHTFYEGKLMTLKLMTH